MIPLTEALRIVLDSARLLETEHVDLADALDRVLAEDVCADIDIPPFDKATVDGYACRRADLAHTLTVVETIPAGVRPNKQIGPDQCAKIMTGAAMPQGADCAIMIEQTETVGGNAIRFTAKQTPDNIFRRAQDIHSGQVVLPKGSRVGPQHIAVLASVGHVRPLVARRPKVGILAGGDELVGPAVRPGPAQIRNSNSSQLAAQLWAMGIEARDYGMVRDVAAEIDRVLRAAIAENDVVLISGGVSVGDFDLVPAVLRQNDVRLLFEKIAVKPGKPTIFGLSRTGYCFGLPGNPVSTFVVFELLVKPFLYKLMGYEYSPVEVEMRLTEAVMRKDTERQSWVPVRLTSGATAAPLEYHGSGHILALCEAEGLMAMDIGTTRIEKGAPVCVRLL